MIAQETEAPPVSSPSARKPKDRWPVTVTSGDVKVKIYRCPVTVAGKSYDSFVVTYHVNGRRERKRYRDLAEAKEKAREIANQKATGAMGAAALTPEARVALQDALNILAQAEGIGTATPSRLIEIVRDYSAARKFMPHGTTLVEAVRFFGQRHPANMPRKSVAEVVTEFIADRESAGCSAIHLRDLRVRLGQFSSAFQMAMAAVSAPLVKDYIYGLKREHDRKPSSNRSKENMLRQIVSLFNFARRMKYIPTELAVEMAEIPTPKKLPAPIGIYSPDDIRKILTAADPEIVPALAVAAFSGLRLAEVARLDWREIRLAERLLVVEAGKSKTAARRLVPISDNLASWLTSHARPFGPVNPCTRESGCVGNALGDRFERAARRAGVKWVRNGLRHSYISYRVATLKDVPAVALEAGNSPNIIFSSYRALASEAEGRAWFGVVPPASAGNVVALPAITG